MVLENLYVTKENWLTRYPVPYRTSWFLWGFEMHSKRVPRCPAASQENVGRAGGLLLHPALGQHEVPQALPSLLQDITGLSVTQASPLVRFSPVRLPPQMPTAQASPRAFLSQPEAGRMNGAAGFSRLW